MHLHNSKTFVVCLLSAYLNSLLCAKTARFVGFWFGFGIRDSVFAYPHRPKKFRFPIPGRGDDGQGGAKIIEVHIYNTDLQSCMHKLSNYIPIVLQNYSGAYLFLQSGTGCLLVFSGIISVEWLLGAVFGSDSSEFRSISRGSGCFGEKKWLIQAVFGVLTYTLQLLWGMAKSGVYSFAICVCSLHWLFCCLYNLTRLKFF